MSINKEPFMTYEYQIEKLKQYLKPVRIAFGVSGKELAAILGISCITYMKYENGHKEITPIMYLAIRGALYDTAQTIEDSNYYEQLWLMFIEGVYIVKGSIVGPENVYVINNDPTEKITNDILEYAKHHKCKPIWQTGCELKQIIRKKYPEIFELKGEIT